MLALTQGAADVAAAIVAQPEAPESAMLRIGARGQSENGASQPDLELLLVEEPEETDLIVEGMPIALDPTMVDFLDDKVLDAEVEGSEVRFSLYLQPSADA
jgi:Fe-S cluster assembly iron-binding protein IscA